MICLLLVIKKSNKSDKLINLLWTSLLDQDIKYENVIANIYELISAVVWSETHLVLM